MQDPTLAGRVAGVNPAAGWAVTKAQQDFAKGRADASKTSADAVGTALKNSRMMLDGITTPEQYMQWHLGNHSDPVLGDWLKQRGVTAEQSLAKIQQAIREGKFPELLRESKLGSEKALENHFAQYDTGAQIGQTVTPKYGSGPATVVPGSVQTKQMTPGTAESNRIAQGNLEVNRGRLALAEKTAETKVSKADLVKEDGKKQLDDIVSVLRQQYDILDKNSGIVSTQNKPLTNFGAAMESSGAGQLVGKYLGTENQSARNQIAMTRPQLLMAIKNATGMTARQLDSNADLKLWLQAATDPALDLQANRAALDNIQKFMTAAKGVTPTDTMTPQDKEALEWANKNPTDPRAAAIKQLHGR